MAHAFALVDAFVDGPFSGNPAGVCLLESEADPTWMQNVGMEINHAETAFAWKRGDGYGLRWFTPTVEIDLCGHATLATVHALGEAGKVAKGEAVAFHTKSGVLECQWLGERIRMDFPSVPVSSVSPPPGFKRVFDRPPLFFGTNGMDWFVELEEESQVLEFEPDFEAIFALGLRGIVFTARAQTVLCDFVSRFFAPTSGVPEDHVTGSAHCALGPYWADKLGRDRLSAFQASKRGGRVEIEVRGPRTVLEGQARTVVTGALLV